MNKNEGESLIDTQTKAGSCPKFLFNDSLITSWLWEIHYSPLSRWDLTWNFFAAHPLCVGSVRTEIDDCFGRLNNWSGEKNARLSLFSVKRAKSIIEWKFWILHHTINVAVLHIRWPCNYWNVYNDRWKFSDDFHCLFAFFLLKTVGGSLECHNFTAICAFNSSMGPIKYLCRTLPALNNLCRGILRVIHSIGEN